MKHVLLSIAAAAAFAPLASAQYMGTMQRRSLSDGLRPGDHNVLLIVLDDLGTEQLAMYDQNPSTAPTPRLDILRQNGILFTNAYANPVCSPTRAALITGRYGLRTGMGAYIDPGAGLDYSLPSGELCLPEMVDEALGSAPVTYARGAFGKWHMSSLDEFGHPTDNGFQRFVGHMANNENQTLFGVDTDHYWWLRVDCTNPGTGTLCDEDAVYLSPPPNAYPFDENTWDASVTRQEAVAWINSLGSTPFFAYVAFNPPHTPRQVPPFSLLSARSVRRLANLGYQPGNRPRSSADRAMIHQAMIEAIDTDIGKLLDGIPTAVLARTTVIVFSDNGTQNDVMPAQLYDASHVLVDVPTGHGKKSVYQLGIRVPMIVTGPLVSTANHGATCAGLVGAVDIWRTTARILGATETQIQAAIAAQPPLPIAADDGVSFLGLIVEPGSQSPRPFAYAEGFLPNGIPLPASPHIQAITDGTFKYILKTYDTFQAQELYDLVNDPHETVNLINDVNYDAIQQVLTDAMTAL